MLEIPFRNHEKWDGTGYRCGLKGNQIALAACIFTMVDFYGALTSDRPYRKTWTKDKVLEHLKAEHGKYFDPQLLDAFMGIKEVANDLWKAFTGH